MHRFVFAVFSRHLTFDTSFTCRCKKDVDRDARAIDAEQIMDVVGKEIKTKIRLSEHGWPFDRLFPDLSNHFASVCLCTRADHLCLSPGSDDLF